MSFDNIYPKKRKTRNDKLNLEIVREFCHETCRLDTSNSSQKILIHNYDGSFDYHQVHIRNQSIKEYYKILEKSSMYAIWRRENATSRNGIEKIPTLKFRSFSNAFCPCCINQNQRDCANHVQVSLVNALKALRNLRRRHRVSEAIKRCTCASHQNVDYISCQTSLASFTSAVSCGATEHPTLSSLSKLPISIKEQEKNKLLRQRRKRKKEKKLW